MSSQATFPSKPELRVVGHEYERRQHALITQAVADGEEVAAVLYLQPQDPDDSGFSCVALADAPKLGRDDLPDDDFMPICVDRLVGEQPELGLAFAIAREHVGATRRGKRWEPHRRWSR